MPQKTILFDLTHNEMLNIEDAEFSEFLNLLKRMDFRIKKTENEHLKKDLLSDVDLLIIGNPIDDYFSSIEVKYIIDFVRNGGGILLLSEYGADHLQKTNLNDISGKFGILFEKNIIKEINRTNQKSSSILSIKNFSKHNITRHIREIVIGGACSLILSKNAKPIFRITKDNAWTEIFNNTKEQWIKEEQGKEQIIAAYVEFGQGKVLAIGDIDIFTNDFNIGINSLDNQRFLQNVINWLIEPVKEQKVVRFLLNQLGDLQYEIRETNKVLNNIIETITILEKRISYLEEHSEFYKLKLENKEKSEIKSIQKD
ncbi:MAG: hypothetical protein ACFFHD_06320 [Promethearchaeota archaeon]